MSNILFNKLRDNEYLFKGIEIVPQLFADGTEWLGYVKSPRPSNGLVFITQDASFIYSENGRELFCAKKGGVLSTSPLMVIIHLRSGRINLLILPR